jgi:hypothetical protein
MENVLTTGFPPTFINHYIIGQLNSFGILGNNPEVPTIEQMVPIFPTSPTNIEDVFKNYIAPPGVSDPLLIQYERLVRFRPNAFYRNKREQVVYYLYCTNFSKITDAHRIITDSLDREDSAAQDVNAWCSDPDTAINPFNVYFHNIRVYQADETRDILELASARTVYANKLVIEYDYHTIDNIEVNGVVYTNPYT